jgi:hypothetical protein
MSGELIIAVFKSRSILTKAIDHIMQLEDLGVVHATIVARASDGRVVFLNDDLGTAEGSFIGGALGITVSALGVAQMGALTLPGIGPVVALGLGALFGGVVGGFTGSVAVKLMQSPDEQLALLARSLQTGHAALVLEVEEAQDTFARVREELQNFRAEVIDRLPAHKM